MIQAALQPELEAEGFRVLPRMRPSLEADETGVDAANRYVLSLLLSLEEDLPEEQQTSLAELADTTLAEYLDQHPGRDEEDWSGDVLIFDQFEEILTVDPTDREAKITFFEQVGQALRDRNRWALFSMREEFVAGLDPYLRPIPTRFATTYRLELLGTDAAREAMQGPAADQDPSVIFTDAAAAKLADDLRTVRVQQPGGAMTETLGLHVEPVQLQVVCRRLWDKPGVIDDDTIDLHNLEDIGDVDEALRGYYADTVANVAAATSVRERAIREWVDRQLITEGGIRGQVLMGEEQSQGLSNTAIWPLVDAHLVRAEGRRGATWFELAHDRLIEPVRRDNAGWFESNLSTLQRQAALWKREGRPTGLLLQDEALSEAEQWAKAHEGESETHEADFLKACRDAREVAERERRQSRRIRVLLVLTSITALAAVGFAFDSVDKRRELKQQARITISAVQAQAKEDRREAYRAQAEAEAAREEARKAMATITALQQEPAIRSSVYSPDGMRILAAGDDGKARVWDADSGQILMTLSGHESIVRSASYSPDGLRIVTASDDGTAKVWDAESGEQVLTLSGHYGGVLSASYAPDGLRIVTASDDGTAKVWDAESGEQVLTLSGHEGSVTFSDYSPDGTRIVTASSDNTAKVWDAVIGHERLTLSGHTDSVNSASYSPDGAYIVTTSDDGTAKVWDAVIGHERLTLSGHTDSVNSASYSPDGAYIVTTSDDDTAKVWDAVIGHERLTLSGHTNSVNSASYSPDGAYIVTTSDDGTARVWDATSGEEVLTPSGLWMVMP